ncbi:hypothetical protein AX17_006905 [Amanita inopinata Kibby_2008]|nr:hypothetical protein AX17_006905 [Amanita inopinata Kibby_2008]
MPVTPCRERRSWTSREDQLLREAVEKEDPENPNPSKWHAIAKHVPNRTNKDCRKRWFAKMASDVVKGGWSPEEDERLVRGIKTYGTRWSQVASIVQTRNSDQCAKRWTDTLNPAIDRTMWTPESDEMLLKAVNEHGKVWTKIVKTYFPGRTGLSAKNRYNSITRFNSDHSRGRARRKSPDSPAQQAHRKSESSSSTTSLASTLSSSSSSSSLSSASSSCNNTPSPVTPPMSIPGSINSSPFHSSIFDTFSGWPSTPSTPMDGSFGHGLSLHLTPQNYENAQQSSLLKPQLIETFHSFDNSLNQTFPSYTNSSITFQNDAVLQQMFSHAQHQPSLYNLGPQDASPIYPQGSMTNDISSQLAMFGSLPAEVDPFMSLAWDNANAQADVKQNDRFIVQSAGESLFIF